MRRALVAIALLTLPAASALAQRMTEAQQKAAAQASAVLDEAVKQIPDIDTPFLQLQAFTQAAEIHRRAGNREQALLTMRQALRFFSESEGSPPGHWRNQAAVRAVGFFASLGELEEAHVTAGVITDASRLPYVFSTLASGHARVGDTATALAIAAKLSDSAGRDSAYRSVAQVCMSRKDFACAQSAAQAMTDSPMKVQLLGQVSARQESGQAAGDASRNLENAREIAEGLPDDKEYELGGWFVGCPRPLQESQRDSALRELAGAQSAAGDFSAARTSLNGVHNQEGRENGLVSVAIEAADRRQFELALSLAGEIGHHECRSVALSSIAVTQHRAGDTDGAQRTLQQIPDLGQRVHALVTIADAHSSRNREAAISTLTLAALAAQQVADPAERFDAMTEVIRRQLAAGLREQASASLFAARAVAEAEMPKKSPQRNWNTDLNRLAGWFAEAGNMQAAVETARRVESFLSHPMMSVARGSARAGNAAAVQSWAATLPTATERTFALLGLAAGILDFARVGPRSRDF